jgi:hypothetical protein
MHMLGLVSWFFYYLVLANVFSGLGSCVAKMLTRNDAVRATDMMTGHEINGEICRGIEAKRVAERFLGGGDAAGRAKHD